MDIQQEKSMHPAAMQRQLARLLPLLMILLVGIACSGAEPTSNRSTPGINGNQQDSQSTPTALPDPAATSQPQPTAVSRPLVCHEAAPASDDRLPLGIYRMDIDGSNWCQLTDSGEIESNPLWSPDGDHIAFVRMTSPNFLDVFVMDADGGNLRNVSNHRGNDSGPVWVPDESSRMLAFVSSRDEERSGTGQLFAVDIDDADPVPNKMSDLHIQWDVAWSPDGEQIAFSSNAYYGGSLQTARIDDSIPRSLTGRDGNALWPAWSPDGTRIAFVSGSRAQGDIYVANLDGTHVVNVTNSPANDRAPAWSPDGSRIVFSSDREGSQDIYVMNADGTNVRQLTDTPDDNTDPSWSPDGRTIVFTNARDWS